MRLSFVSITHSIRISEHTHYIQTTCVKVAVYNSFVYFFMILELYTVKRVELTVEFESSVGCLFSKSIKH